MHSLAAEHPLSKWEGQSSIPAQKERKGGEEGGREGGLYFQDLQDLQTFSQKTVGHISKKVIA